jgi:hypothetical protein
VRKRIVIHAPVARSSSSRGGRNSSSRSVTFKDGTVIADGDDDDDDDDEDDDDDIGDVDMMNASNGYATADDATYDQDLDHFNDITTSTSAYDKNSANDNSVGGDAEDINILVNADIDGEKATQDWYIYQCLVRDVRREQLRRRPTSGYGLGE